MKLFENEIITINKIYTVDKYVSDDTTPKFQKYGSNFSTYELVYFLSGEGNTTLGAVKIHDCPGSIRYMPKGRLNGEYTVEKIKNGICFDIFFDVLTPISTSVLHGEGFFDLKDKFLKLYKTWTDKKSGYYSRSMMIFYDIINTLCFENQSYVSVKQRDYMQKAYDYILANYKSVEFDYKELCEVSGLKYTQFNDVFKKNYNMTPVRLVTKMRLDYAKELLITSHYKISEIAELCGFDNQYYFSNVFKKETGFSPSKYPFGQTD